MMTPRTYLLLSVVVLLVVCVSGGVDRHRVKRQAKDTTQSSSESDTKESAEVTTVKSAVIPAQTGAKNDSSKAESRKDEPGGTSTKADSSIDDDDPEHKGLKSLSSDAVLRGFYVFIGIGTIVLVYIAIKFVRLRRRPSIQKYRVLSTTNDQEMLPLAADDGEDEEIYNAADHQHSLK